MGERIPLVMVRGTEAQPLVVGNGTRYIRDHEDRLDTDHATHTEIISRLWLVGTSLGARLIDAVAARNATKIAACFADEAEFRALVPPGLRERSGAAETAALMAGWFADSTELDLVDSNTDEVGDTLHVSYRLEGVEDGEPYLVEQHLYCSVEADRIKRASLLCSGFRPRAR